MKIFIEVIFIFYILQIAEAQNTSIELHLKRSRRQLSYDDIKEDGHLTTPELIFKYGYPSEIHTVQTSDGYILEMHRIPYGKISGPSPNKPIVLLMHGILSSSADWVNCGPLQSLDILLDLLQLRRHITLSTSNPKFWDFTFHEMGTIDLPSMIDYIFQKTNQMRLFYIGHSQGNTVFFVICSERPEYNSKIKAMFSLAPVVYMSHMFSPILKAIGKGQVLLTTEQELLGPFDVFQKNNIFGLLGRTFCNDAMVTKEICADFLFLFFGFNRRNLNTTLLPVILSHIPAGASTKNMAHLEQLVDSGKFRKFDYGKLKNKLIYGQWEPPSYNLKRVTAPVSLYYSTNDWISSVIDVFLLKAELPNIFDFYHVLDLLFNHIDYLFGINTYAVIYNRIIYSLGLF